MTAPHQPDVIADPAGPKAAGMPAGPGGNPDAPPDVSLATMANAVRALAMDAVEQAGSGHPGLPLGMASAATALFTRILKTSPRHPRWPDRDRFVLSAGHGSMLLYALLHLTGHEDVSLGDIRRFRQLGAPTAGHPEFGLAAGIETTTGPLGQGLGNAVGMALAERIMNARFGDGIVDHYTYVIASDGDLMEGLSHEAISLAGHLGLGRLIVLFDDNGISIDGPLDLAESGDVLKRFQAAGWRTAQVDGLDPDAVAKALAAAQEEPDSPADSAPALIACRTVIGFGAPGKQGTAAAHGAPLGAEDIAGARSALGWDAPPFTVPDPVLAAWRRAGARSEPGHDAWQARLADLPAATGAEFTRRMSGAWPASLAAALAAHKAQLAASPPACATRQASGRTLEAITAVTPELIGGSADLTGSNNVRTAAQKTIRRGDFAGSYVHYGVREHAMAAAMNGMALHGGVIPYGGSFLAFTDYCRPALRLSALMGVRVIYVMTHDSIGLGEDGPTHQPVEHLAGLRAIPNLLVFRPADAMETAECWEVALAQKMTPSVFCLSRQTVPPVRTAAAEDNPCARGGYVLAPADGAARVTFIATGSEVAIALEARRLMQDGGCPAQVVSLPCMELFARQPRRWRDQILGAGTVRVAMEAAVRQGWDQIIGPDGAFIGMDGFGASAPAADLYAHFGIDARAAANAARARLEAAARAP